MKNYRVKMHYSEYYYCEIQAENYEAALHRAKKIEISQCQKDDYSDWLVLDVNEIKLSASDLAFADAYQHAVGSAPKEIVKIWLHSKDHDKFCDQYSEYYGSITDAYEIWLMAQSFIKENSK